MFHTHNVIQRQIGVIRLGDGTENAFTCSISNFLLVKTSALAENKLQMASLYKAVESYTGDPFSLLLLNIDVSYL